MPEREGVVDGFAHLAGGQVATALLPVPQDHADAIHDGLALGTADHGAQFDARPVLSEPRLDGVELTYEPHDEQRAGLFRFGLTGLYERVRIRNDVWVWS